MHDWPVCAYTKKARYTSQTEAAERLFIIQFFGWTWRKEKRVYQCRHCRGWHLTSQSFKPQKNEHRRV